MPRYVRARLKGSVFFFTVVLADRSSRLLVDEIDRLRNVYRTVQQRRSFETIAISILPDHIHAVWALPEGDADFSSRWSLIKSGFSRGLAPCRDQQAICATERRVSGNVAIGSTPFATMLIWSAISTMSISSRSSTYMSHVLSTGHIAAFIAMSSVGCLPQTGAAI
jgi:REP element-mobilizing transposase RayT